MPSLTLPGYNYCGPGNKLDNGEPTCATDAACKRHDQAYTDLIDAGETPYTHWVWADQQLLDAIKDNNDYGAHIAREYFTLKKAGHIVNEIWSGQYAINHAESISFRR
jgi:hypothetical protein